MMNMAVIHISEAEAARDFSGVLARVSSGEEVVIDRVAAPPVVMSVAVVQRGPGRLLSEAIASAEARGSSATIDEDFARDVAEAVAAHREPLNPPAWD
jgi:antitoxin (DNA-binding transcriptional repressor) of toxin-antitoxin stability system